MGLGDQIAIPAILQELHNYLPSNANSFLWSDARGNVQHIYDERPQALTLLPLYLSEFYNRLELEVFCGWPQVLRHATRTVDFDSLLTVDRRCYDRHPYYQEGARKLDFYWGLCMVVRENGRPLGALTLHRSRNECRFEADEARRLDHIMPFIAHAFVAAGDLQHDWVDSEDEGLVITGRRGKLVSASVNGQRLLALASSDRPWSTARHGAAPSPLDLLRILCRRLTSVDSTAPDTDVPTVTIENAWGRFVLRAYWMHQQRGVAESIGICIRRQEPMPLLLTRKIGLLPLSSKQAGICFLMAGGQTYNQIAQQQGIKRNTAISHGREIYDRLDVHNREQLLTRILSAS